MYARGDPTITCFFKEFDAPIRIASAKTYDIHLNSKEIKNDSGPKTYPGSGPTALRSGPVHWSSRKHADTLRLVLLMHFKSTSSTGCNAGV